MRHSILISLLLILPGLAGAAEPETTTSVPPSAAQPALQTQLATAQQQLVSLRADLATRDARIRELEQQLAVARRAAESARTQAQNTSAASNTLEQNVAAMRQQITDLTAERDTLQQTVAARDTSITKLRTELAAVQQAQTEKAQAAATEQQRNIRQQFLLFGSALAVLLLAFGAGSVWRQRKVRRQLGGLDL